MLDREKSLKKEIIKVGKRLYDVGLVVARSGNISARLGDDIILITATGTSLGDLKEEDIVDVGLVSGKCGSDKKPSTELPLHSLIYKNFSHHFAIHCHPPLINAYFAVCPDLKILTFETKLYLGNVPVVEQDTPAVVNPEPVIEALRLNNLVILKNHGVIAAADKLKDALYLIETLEEAVKTIAVARLLNKEALDSLDKELKGALVSANVYTMFSQEHIQAIVDLVNRDEFFFKKGQEMDLTLQLAVKMDGEDKVYKFTFEKGRITGLENDDNAPFVISAPADIWEAVFLGKVDPFVATTQGKMKLKGDFARLSRWYVAFARLFELFKQVKIK